MPCLQAGCSLAELARGHPTLQHPQAHQLGAVGGVGGCEGGTQPLTRADTREAGVPQLPWTSRGSG